MKRLLPRTAVLKSATEVGLARRSRLAQGAGPFGAMAVALMLLWGASPASAALFGDDEARRAILDLRQRLEQVQRQLQSQSDENAQLRQSLLDLQSQIDTVKAELARSRGQSEQLARDLTELQQRQKDVQMGLDDRLRRFEPVKVSVDGVEFSAEPAEKRDYEQALELFRKADYVNARQQLQAFMTRYPGSGYQPSVLFWLGNAEYVAKDYKEALGRFRQLLETTPGHPRAPEALLATSNVQIELKDLRAARKTLETLLAQYPQSEAAQAARERLARLPAAPR